MTDLPGYLDCMTRARAVVAEIEREGVILAGWERIIVEAHVAAALALERKEDKGNAQA